MDKVPKPINPECHSRNLWETSWILSCLRQYANVLLEGGPTRSSGRYLNWQLPELLRNYRQFTLQFLQTNWSCNKFALIAWSVVQLGHVVKLISNKWLQEWGWARYSYRALRLLSFQRVLGGPTGRTEHIVTYNYNIIILLQIFLLNIERHLYRKSN